MMRLIVGVVWMALLCAGCVLACVASVSAQTPIIVGPSTVLQWDACAPVTLAVAYTLTVDGTAQPAALANVTCVAGTGTLATCPTQFQTCSVPVTTIPMGSHTVTMTATASGVTSLPSVPFSYIDMVIPVPQGLRFK